MAVTKHISKPAFTWHHYTFPFRLILSLIRTYLLSPRRPTMSDTEPTVSSSTNAMAIDGEETSSTPATMEERKAKMEQLRLKMVRPFLTLRWDMSAHPVLTSFTTMSLCAAFINPSQSCFPRCRGRTGQDERT